MAKFPCSLNADFFVSRNRGPLYLPKIYASLSHFSKANNGYFDSWKGSFGFQFLLKVEKAGIQGEFLHNIFHYRNCIHAPLYHLVPTSVAGPSNDSLKVIPKELFSKSDFEAYSSAFVDTMLDKLVSTQYKPNPFVISAASEGLLAGFDGDKYFKRYVECEDLSTALDALEKKGFRVV